MSIERIARGSGDYWTQRKESNCMTGLLPYFEQEFIEIRTLLLSSMKKSARARWIEGVEFSNLRNTFEDLLTSAGVTTYKDGSTAFLGAYMSLYDFTAASIVCEEFSNDELEALRKYYDGERYLSPIFALVASSCESKLKRRLKEQEVVADAQAA